MLYTNPRGSTSYGQEFANLIHHKYPGQDYDDLMSAGDIRRDAAYLMGVVVTSFDEEYTKELSDGVILKIDAINRFTIWKAYLEKIINPDYTSTIQQKRWIGYTLRIFIRTVLQNSNENDREKFIKIFLNFLKREDYDNLTTFILVETLNYIPLDWENFKDESSKNNSKIETPYRSGALRVVCASIGFIGFCKTSCSLKRKGR